MSLISWDRQKICVVRANQDFRRRGGSAVEPIIKGGIYQHYKGNRYRLLDVVRHSETLEEMVLYETLYESELGKLWVRPKAMFLEKLSDGRPRFKFVGDGEP